MLTKPLKEDSAYALVISIMSLIAAERRDGLLFEERKISLPGNVAGRIVITPAKTTRWPSRPSSLQYRYAVVSPFDLGIAIAGEKKIYAANWDIVFVGDKVRNIAIEQSIQQQGVPSNGSLLSLYTICGTRRIYRLRQRESWLRSL